MKRLVQILCAALVLGPAFHTQSALACAACFGGPTDSPLARGMNWGIFSLLAVVVSVLGAVATFFIYLARKSARTPVILPDGELLPSTQKA